jgi:hypothetical protein
VNDEQTELLREMRDLLRLIAEPAIAERDAKLRDELRRIVGRSSPRAKSAQLMDGNRSQRDIHRETAINEGDLSVFVKKLKDAKLLTGDGKPKLTISIPPTFFDGEGNKHDRT